MRKELTVFLESSEPEIEYSLRQDVGDTSRILLTFEGMRLSFNPTDLIQAISELNKFYQVADDNLIVETPVPLKRNTNPKPIKLPNVNMFPINEGD